MKSFALIAIIASCAFAATLPINQATGYDLIKALENENETEAIRLIEDGTDANVSDADRYSPMHWAAKLGYNKVIDLLMEKGYKSQLHNRTIGFRTPLSLAVRMHNCDTAELLIKHGSDIDAAEMQISWNPLRLAAWTNDEEMVKILLKNGADIHATNWFGSTARDIAEGSGHLRIVRLLDEEDSRRQLEKAYTNF
ncbi:ankyrin repeat and SOCS box protein 3-like [Contarinia nasturtii]|uniref:ankyrin repeat and SOCS box protein 3-like n=1 Tax=Contarinia nasturtii TaxID=265458 RepID=UPI0012D3E392|nr:ankyrin repeat and SOCS box protein 3-like [Contarinia nasturtii]